MKQTLLLLFSCLLLNAQIKFDSPTLEFDTKPGQKKVDAKYNFKNVGDYTVTIKKIKPTCGCTTAKLDKKTYKPGESGTIAATINVPDRGGRLAKSIRITTDDKDKKKIKLTLVLHIPKYVDVSPKYISWEHKGAKVSKTISIKVLHKTAIHIKKVHSSNPNWIVKLETVTKGKEYKITITPPTTEKSVRTSLSIESDFPTVKPLVFSASARVKPKPYVPKKKNWFQNLF
ncbi:MAG: DUF1573 domain-containing protein [Lentisphaeria bacterium]|nr:DUF1573 domain-containing protein [Lentisphaeria bacterium]NQZ68078.1 DUF1573 domain-containing protein [Lentisphaeria bacterium]